MVAARMTRTLVTAGLLAAVWVAWSWHFEPLIVGFGVVAVALTVFIARRLQVLDEETVPFEINLRLFVYLPWLAWEVVKANWQVAKVILNPKLPISPRLISAPANQKTVVGQVMYANSITLTPGTISLDVRENQILVHALTQEAADGVLSGDMGRRIAAMEAED